MGAKAPEKLKIQRSECKCESCGRKFLNVQALTSHRKFMHKTETPAAKRVALKKETGMKQAKTVQPVTKKVSNRLELKKSDKMPVTKTSTKNDNKPENNVSEVKKRASSKKTEFKCPKCAKIFSVYFSAYRHIQKYHCVDDNDEPVPPNSSAIIKPIPVEQSPCCNEWVTASEVHTCKRIAEYIVDMYMCLGCQQTFDNLLLFEHHVKGLHSTGAEYYFFPSDAELTPWKMDLEQVSNVKFVTLTSNLKSKRTYHCSYQPALKTEKTLLCPSSLLVTELKNGYQVTYFKEHFGHSCMDLSPEKYKKFCINILSNDISDIQSIDNDDNVYQQFKYIMNNITVNAAKVDIGVLNTLLGKALEMTVALNSVIKDDEVSTNKTMTDEQISDVLAEVKTYPGKRKSESIKKDVKRIKPSAENDENSKINNTLPNKGVNKFKKVDEIITTPIPRPAFNQSPSFNDTYKDFVDQNFKTVIPETSTPKKSSVKKKIVMKTKIGQFKVKPSLSPKASKESKEVKEFKESKEVKESKDKEKEKSLSPITPKKTIEYKIKPDIKYEVKERENDCNILILKI